MTIFLNTIIKHNSTYSKPINDTPENVLEKVLRCLESYEDKI